jgi:protein SCO1/2
MRRLRVLALCVLGSLGASRGTAAALEPPPASAATGVDERPGARLPLQATFVATTGEQVALGQLLGRGRPALLVLAYNRCTTLCSLVLRGVSDLLRRFDWVPGRQFSVVTISIDPDETPHEAARTQQAVLDRAGYPGQTGRWWFLVGDRQSIDAVAGAVGFRYRRDPRTGQYAHPAVVFAISGAGAVVRYFYGLRLDPAEVRAALSGQPGAAAPVAGSAILNCFRFDAIGRRYGGLIQRLFQIGAGTVFLVLIAGLLVLSRTNRVRS